MVLGEIHKPIDRSQEDMERGELAGEAGMLHGIDAYNEMNGDS